MSQSYLNLLGLAVRANKCSLGVDKIVQDIQNKEIKLVLIANDSSPVTQKRLTDKCHSYDIPHYIVDDIATISQAIGQFNRVAIGIKDEGFATSLSSRIQGN